MSLPKKKELESNDENSNLCNSDEPKTSQEQRSLVDPSTEIGSNSYHYNIIYFFSWNK